MAYLQVSDLLRRQSEYAACFTGGNSCHGNVWRHDVSTSDRRHPPSLKISASAALQFRQCVAVTLPRQLTGCQRKTFPHTHTQLTCGTGRQRLFSFSRKWWWRKLNKAENCKAYRPPSTTKSFAINACLMEWAWTSYQLGYFLLPCIILFYSFHVFYKLAETYHR